MDRNNVETAFLLTITFNCKNRQFTHNHDIKNHRGNYDEGLSNGDKTLLLLCCYLSFSFVGPSWLHGSASSPQSLLTHQAVGKRKNKKQIHWEVVSHKMCHGSIY